MKIIQIYIYINNKKIKFNHEYKCNEDIIKVKIKFKKSPTSTGWMFYNCIDLKSLDLSSFNTNNVNNMSYMFYG